MIAQQIKVVLALLVFFCAFSIVLPAQKTAPFEINECGPTERVLPPINAQLVPKSATETHLNKFKFELDWDSIPGSCHTENPSPIVEGQDSVARWAYFWNFGDGTFSTESKPVHAFPAGTFTVQTAIKPIYSDDDDPLGFSMSTITIGATDITPTYEDSIASGKSVALDVNWPGCQPNGRLLFALTYPKIQSSEDLPFDLFLVYPDSVFHFKQMQSGPAPNSDFTEDIDGVTHRFYKWRMEDIQNDGVDHDEGSVVVELEVDSMVADLLPDTFSQMETNVMAMIRIDTVLEASENILGISNPKVIDDNVFNSTGAAKSGDSGVGTPYMEGGIDDLSSQTIMLSWASDPNGISVEPKILEPGTKNAFLKYEIQFYNGGSATAENITVQVPLDSLIRKNIPGPFTASTHPSGFSYSLVLENVAKWENGSAGLPSLGQANTVGFSHDSTFGHIKYNVMTKEGRVLLEGDTIRAQATIDMENSNVETNETIVRVQDIKISYPCVWGFKAYYNFRLDDEAFHRSGYNLAVTLRKPLGKISNPGNRYYFAGARIPKSAFPTFWWQAELGYGQTHLQRREADSLRLGHLDLTPFMLRFIAKKPDLRVGSLVVKRGWGFSAGYTSSFLLHGSNGGQSISFSDVSFGDRLDHSFSASLDFLNLIGQPGLSFGLGWRWRNTAAAGQREWYDHPFVYAHYTFSYRLRYELRPFN